MHNSTDLASAVKQLLVNGISSDFTGFGAVIYTGEFDLIPTLPLINDSEIKQSINESIEIAGILISISQYRDNRHDGFHFIHRDTGLTHLSAYISPEIPKKYSPKDFNVGARFRTAELVSMMKNIDSVLIVEKSGLMHQFVLGKKSRS